MIFTPPFPSFTAVLLAGGRSTRMGVDKAGLIVDGQPLWRLQLDKLRALEAGEIFISGRAEGPYADAGIEVVPDTAPGLGPLGGIAAMLRLAAAPLVIVLAVDLPAVSVAFLAGLVARAAQSRLGVVPQGDRWFEPLAAVYPQAAAPLAEECLCGVDRSMQHFVRRLVAAGLASALPLTAAQLAEFRNVNAPGDL